MPDLENLKKQAKLILRWHREGRYPVAERIRKSLPACQGRSDREILERPFRLAEAQEMIARENGFENWKALKSGFATMTKEAKSETNAPKLVIAFPQVFVRDVSASCAFYRDKLGFAVTYCYGSPPFYALVERGGAALNLRHVDGPVFHEGVRGRDELLAANIVVENVKELFREVQKAGVALHQTLRKEPWGAEDFVVADPDGNLILFASRNFEK